MCKCDRDRINSDRDNRKSRNSNTGKRIWRRGLPVILIAICVLLTGCGRGSKAAEDEQMLSEADAENRTFDEPSVDAEDGLTRMLTTAVQIRAGGLSGSGVIYGETEGGLVMLTAAHVMADAAAGASVTFYDGYEISSWVFWIFPDVDCAFLVIPYEELPQDWTDRYLTAEKDRSAFDTLKKEDGLFLADPENENEFGYRFALLVENWIYVQDFGQYMMLLSGDVDAGMSGCGVFDESGCFLGILCGENEEGELAVMPYSVVEAKFIQVK